MNLPDRTLRSATAGIATNATPSRRAGSYIAFHRYQRDSESLRRFLDEGTVQATKPPAAATMSKEGREILAAEGLGLSPGRH